MNKEEFLKRLKSKLEILDEKEVNDILQEYSEHIEEKIKSGSSEKDAIKEFGNIDDLAKDILGAYKINKDYSNDRINSFIDNTIDRIKVVFDKVIKIISHGTTKDIIKFVALVIILLLMIGLLKIPFTILEEILDNAFGLLPSFLQKPFDVLVSIVVNISYVVLSFIIFIRVLDEKLLASYVVEEKVVKEKETKKRTKSSSKEDDVIVEKHIEKKVVYKNERTFLDSIGDLFLIVFRVIAVFVLIPCIMGVVCSSIGIAGLVLFSIKYYFLFGPIILCIGLLVGSVWITEVLFRFVANKSGSFIKSFITFVVALVLCGAGIGISVIEVGNFKYESYKPDIDTIDTYTFNTKEFDKVVCYECDSVIKTVNSELKDYEYIVNIYGDKYYESGYNTYYRQGYDKEISFHFDSIDMKIITEVLNNIKKGIVYDYDDIFDTLSIEIIANEKTLELIKASN